MLITILTVVLAVFLVPSVESSVPSQVNIGYSFNGTGCPTNSLAGSISTDFGTLVLSKIKKERNAELTHLT
jgi:hypothetical protein